MTVVNVIRYELQPDERSTVEEAMRTFADYVATALADSSWVTYREVAAPHRYLSILVAKDEEAEKRHRSAEGTRRFVDVLGPRLAGQPESLAYEIVARSAASG